MDRTVMPQCSFAELVAVVLVVAVIGKAGAAVVAALHDVLCNAGHVEAGEASHAVEPVRRQSSIDVVMTFQHRRSPIQRVGNEPDPFRAFLSGMISLVCGPPDRLPASTATGGRKVHSDSRFD